MDAITELIFCQNESKNKLVRKPILFDFKETNELLLADSMIYPELLDKLVFRVARKPKRLVGHVQRIYHCFHLELQDQLYGAIVDFLVVLEKRGANLSWRLVMGCKPILSSVQFQVLRDFLKDSESEVSVLNGNQYSIFSKGKLENNSMVILEESQADYAVDPLVIAQDYIQYCQLEQAKLVLEAAVLKQIGRYDLQLELLAIYQSTRDVEGFTKMYAKLGSLAVNIMSEWEELNSLFNKGRNSDG